MPQPMGQLWRFCKLNQAPEQVSKLLKDSTKHLGYALVVLMALTVIR
jgi:hypothetical protein